MKQYLSLLFFLTFFCIRADDALAGRSCEGQQPPSPKTIVQGLELAEKTLHALEKDYAGRGTRVVVLARAGQDLSKYRLKYSHLGWAYRRANGQWLVAHKLNTCGSATAQLYRHGLGEFFLDDLFKYEAAWVVPNRSVQQKMLPVLEDIRLLNRLHTPAYNMVSYPWSQQYQQSNQWAIETLATALDSQIKTRESAQTWLKQSGYLPSTLEIGAMTRLGGRITQANVVFDDHPNNRRFANQIDTVTVDSVFSWLGRAGLGEDPRVLR
jgi:hypothetical protein